MDEKEQQIVKERIALNAIKAAMTISDYCLMNVCETDDCVFYSSKWNGCLFDAGGVYPPESWDLE